ncbi:MAG: peptidoglycan-binding protein [Acidimicrobiales bacterium]
MRRAMVVVAALSLVVAACGDTDGDGDQDLDPIAAAEQRVTRAQDDVDGAQASFDDASDDFCGSASDYVSAVDRYGRLFTDAEATVGDVTTAGRDLEAPQGDVVDSANAARDAREDLATAQQELAEAQAALASAQAEAGSSTTESDTTTTTIGAVVEPSSIERVTEAQDDLDAAFEGVDSTTTLAAAGEQVNAAAYALEVAWLRVLDDAGCLSDDQQADAVDAVSSYTSSLQTSLTAAGYFDGTVDGVYGPATADAVKQLQTDSGLPATGFVDQATATALHDAVAATGADAEDQAIAHTAAVQSMLTLAGYWTGPIDGEWTDALTAAVKELQNDVGVPATGVIDAATLVAVEDAIAEATKPDDGGTTTTTAEDDGSTTTTTAP